MTAWIAIILTGIGWLVTSAVSWGYNKKRFETIEESAKTNEQRYNDYHKLHFQHSTDAEVHWTKRERDDLSRDIEKMSNDIDESLKRDVAK